MLTNKGFGKRGAYMWLQNYAHDFWGSDFSDGETKVYVPNNIFEELPIECFDRGQHKLFAIVYYSLISWIYRYAKFDDIFLTTKDLTSSTKIMAGLSPKTKTLNYVIVKNGVLDKQGITRTTSILKAPYQSYYDEYTNFVYFDYLDDFPIKNKYPKRLVIKEPLLSLEERVYQDIVYLGSFQDIENTFCFNMKDYIYMSTVLKMSYEEIGFYYYLLSRQGMFGENLKISRLQMSRDLGVPEKAITRYKQSLLKHKIIKEILGRKGINNTIKIQNVSDLYASTNS